MNTDPNQLDQQHEDAFIAAIQPGAPLEVIDAFIDLHQQVVNEQEAHEQQIFAENQISQ